MGSGEKFRVSVMPWQVWSLGIAVAQFSEHRVSISIDLVKISIYIGFGKGYDEGGW